jgi:tetratricopeptide (TPR) repeat protein
MPLSDSKDGITESTSSPKRQALTASAQPLADLEHPWLGLESFREETRAYFFGRDAEIAELHLRLRSDPLLVLYGRSGLGKTSILMAGLIPRLRAEKRVPLLLRLWYEESAQGVFSQLVSAIFGREDSQRRSIPLESKPTKSLVWTQRLGERLGLSLPDDLASRLWLRLHYRDEPPDITHLILDQFEEVFTLGAREPGAEENVRDILAILLQGAVPKPIGRLISEHDSFGDHFDPDSVPVRVILALRSDYVYALNRWRRHLPALGQNSFELHPLRGPGAFKAVFNPGELRCHYRGVVNKENRTETGLQPIITGETAQRIVRFVAQKGEEVPIEEIEAVPPILSLLCRELNERRFTKPAGTPETPAAQITFSEGDADIETIISTFYERCLAGRPEAVRTFIEEELVSFSGARLAQDQQSILKVFTEGCQVPGAGGERHAAGFGDAVAARGCLEELVSDRLLSSLGGGENPSYELIHDLLAGVVEKSRTARQERFEKEEAARLAEAERKAKEKAEQEARLTRSRALKVVITVSAALAVAVLAAIIGFVEYSKAVAAKREAQEATKRATDALKEVEKAKSAADELIRFMQYDLRDTLGKLGHLGMMGAINTRIMKYYEGHPPKAEDFAALREREVAIDQQADVLSAQGDLAGALKSYRDSLAIAEKLAKQDPSNVLWQGDLAWSFRRVGQTLHSQGKLTEALAAFQNSKETLERLTAKDSSNTRGQWNLAVCYGDIGAILRAQGKLAEALVAFQQYKDGMEHLAKQDPSNAGSQRDLSNSYYNVGDVQSAQSDLAGALKSYRDSLAIAEKLAKQDPSNANLQRDLSFSYNKVGEVQSAQGDFAGALKSYRDSLAIAEKLAKQDPSNASWQADLAYSYWRTGTSLVRSDPNSRNEARSMIEKGRDILRQLKERTGLGVLQQSWLDSIEADLQKMQKRNDNSGKAIPLRISSLVG